jgi:FMN phosphatase YigB (HAD superfamily)
MGATRSSFRFDAGDRSSSVFTHPSPLAASQDTARPRLAVDGVIFDTADVLYDATLWPRKLVRLVHRVGLSAGYDELIGDWERNYLTDVYCGRRAYDEALQAFILAAGHTWAQIDEFEAPSRIERQSLDVGVRPQPGVVHTVAHLRRCELGLVAWADSSHPAAKITERIDRLGLAGAFHAVLSSFDLEAAQPSSQCYDAALAALGLPAAGVAYVGHDALHLAGAKAAGLHTIAFNHRGEAQADVHLTGFDELLAVLDRTANA